MQISALQRCRLMKDQVLDICLEEDPIHVVAPADNPPLQGNVGDARQNTSITNPKQHKLNVKVRGRRILDFYGTYRHLDQTKK